jgi:hypothetical protein
VTLPKPVPEKTSCSRRFARQAACAIPLALLLGGHLAVAQTRRIGFDFSAHWNGSVWRGQTERSPGKPRVPIYPVRVLLPYGERLRALHFEGDAEWAAFPVRYETAPLPRPLCDCDWTPPRAWREPWSGWYPRTRLGEPWIASRHGFRIVYVSIYPEQITPDARSRRVTRGTLVVETERDSARPAFRGLRSDRTEIASALSAEGGDASSLATYPVSRFRATLDYLVIAPQAIIDDNDPDSLNRLLFEKNDKGVAAAAISVESIEAGYTGADIQEKIRNAITDYYKTRGIQYVLLVGDGYTTTPTRSLTVKLQDMTGAIPSDYYFACLDGDFVTSTPDVACEVAVGRAPANTPSDMHAFVRKTLLMAALSDQDPRLSNELNFGEVLDPQTLGSPLIDQLLTGGHAGTLSTEGYPAATAVQKLYETFTAAFAQADILEAINDGQFYTINHVGHCNEANCLKIDAANLPQLNNAIPFFLLTQGCYPGNLSVKNWASTLVLSPNGGAGAVIANSNYGFYDGNGSPDGPSNRFHLAFYDTLFRSGVKNLGKIAYQTKAELIPQMQQDPTMQWVAFETNLLGDPELALRPSLVRP